MKTYFTSDPHFGHKRIIELCNRPFADVDEMNEALLDGINSVVTSQDRLVITGDIIMGKLEEGLPLLGRINAAELVMLPGNHDRWALAYHHKGDAQTKREEFRTRYEEQHPNGTALVDRETSGWRGWELGYDRKHPLGKVWFSHYPYDGDSHGEDRHAGLRVPDAGKLPIIHGHVHEEWKIKGRQFNVGVDVNDFKPVSEEELVAWVSSL